MPEFPALKALSPLDGRYRSATEVLSEIFSEEAIIRYRIRVEVEYFKALLEFPLPGFASPSRATLDSFTLASQSQDAAFRVKNFEKQTNHDVKAVEYFLRECADETGLDAFKELIHFGLTSQDINNTAFPLAVKDAWHLALKPALFEITHKLEQLSGEWQDIPMLARTHGQAASPTILGKEIWVFVERLNNQIRLIQELPFSGKFGGATGNFNAHFVSFPEIDWPGFADHFLMDRLGLDRQQTTTQIEHYDMLAAFFDNLKRINTILLDLDRDLWTYVSMDYFKQRIKANEVGSSAMPHKVNPIDFENSEGNLGLANAILEHLSSKLPVSRLQRDLTDSTVIRNIGVPFGHSLIAWHSLLRGLNKLIINEPAIHQDLEKHPAVLAEAIQSILRRAGVDNPYDLLKKLTRTNEEINKASLTEFVNSLDISQEIKDRIVQLSPSSYTGLHPWKTNLKSK